MEAGTSRLGLNRSSRVAPLPHSGGRKGCEPLQVEQPADHQGLLPDVFQGSPEESPEPVLLFGFAPELLDLLPGPLAPLVAASPLAGFPRLTTCMTRSFPSQVISMTIFSPSEMASILPTPAI